MLQDANAVDPWTRTIDLLSLPAGVRPVIDEAVDWARHRTLTEKCSSRWGPFVRVVDRPSALTVTLDWRDSTKCCYREQLWVAGRARVSGRCAMSGAPILPGDDIFRPRPARPAPRNVSAMVLAAAVDAYVACETLYGPRGVQCNDSEVALAVAEPLVKDLREA
ncbi:DUF3331 domain-containing protein [Paraburkholderia sp. DHOC27]|uniref:DUF3331 domain-containing protein n=1 Tax=Paraburkholderia sp. DHOC27 TaxID=2303330 RepID=UPI000E3CBE27|nr:DUF3331 domain-containing protein [Paraburkholderia sp. DHOC27]RFU49657.1 DUF3331 domain-containing protein [Paraburkholderia sp. DHOC27]